MLRPSVQSFQRAPLPLHFAPPPTGELHAVVKRLIERYGSGDTPRKSDSELDALLRRLRKTHYQWESVSPSDRLDIAWVLWRGADPPAEQGCFLHAFLNWVETPWRRVQARRLASAWAVAFDPERSSIRLVGE